MQRNHQSGSALLLVVLILLVLSGLGIAMLSLTDSSREEVSQDDHLKDAFYVAEMGLRAGETILIANDPSNATSLMQHVSTAQTPALNLGTPSFPQTQSQYDLAHLGTYLTTPTGQELANQSAALPGSPTGKSNARAFYSLCIRNNPNDPSVADQAAAGTDAKVDNDETLNLVSIGWITKGGKILSVKIMEEEYSWLGLGLQLQGQKGLNAGNLNQGQYGGG